MHELQVHALFSACVPWYATCNCGVAIKSGESLYVVRTCTTLSASKTNLLSYPFELMDGCDPDAIAVQKTGSRYRVGKSDIIIWYINSFICNSHSLSMRRVTGHSACQVSFLGDSSQRPGSDVCNQFLAKLDILRTNRGTHGWLRSDRGTVWVI